MKKIIFALLFLIPIFCSSQTIIFKYSKAIDFDGIKKRTYPESGYWVLSNDTLVNHYKDGELIKNLQYVMDDGTYVYLNDFNEIVYVRITEKKELIVQNLNHPKEYTIFK